MPSDPIRTIADAPTEEDIEAAIVKDPKAVLVVLFEADAEVQRLRTALREIAQLDHTNCNWAPGMATRALAFPPPFPQRP